MSLNPINGPVILVEDDPALREATVQALELSGLQVQPFESAARAARFVIPSFAGCIVTDIRMDGMDGLHLFAKVMEIDREIPVVLITGHGDIGMAVRAMQDGAFDFLAKPFATEHLVAVVRKALQSRHLVLDNRALRNALAAPDEDMVAHSRVMGQLRNMASQVARTALDVTIEGEAGTGKELLARRIHQQSSRLNRPFHVVSGASISHDIDLNQLIETVNGGTLFLDGGDCLPLSVQARLVAALDARDRSRGMNDDDNDFRLITSNPIALSEMLQSGSLREDLFHRLNSITLRIPPLRDRRDDIPALFAKFVRDALEQTGKKRFEMNATDRKHLLEHHWPGNARELRNYVFGAVLNLPRPALSPMISSVSKPLSTRVNAFERMIIEETLTKTGGNVVRACKLLATPRKTLYEKFAKYEIQPRHFRLGQKNAAKSI
jgi:two-component system, NtrC family, C4-dicarboxylate transport response regulator DctD